MTHTTWAEYAAANHDPATHFICDCCGMVTPKELRAPGYGPIPGHDDLEQGLCMRCLVDWGRFANKVRVDTVGAACGIPVKSSQPGVFDHIEPWLSTDRDMAARLMVSSKKDPERYREQLAAYFHRYAEAVAANQGVFYRDFTALRATEKHLDEIEQQKLSIEAQKAREERKAEEARASADAQEQRRRAQREALEAKHAELEAKARQLRGGAA